MLDYTGNTVPGWPVTIADEIFGHAHLVIADIDQNGNIEIIMLSDHIVRAWKADGSIFPGFPMDLHGGYGSRLNDRSPLAGDIDGDGDTEIIAILGAHFLGRTENEYVYLGKKRLNKLMGINIGGSHILDMPKYIPYQYGEPSGPVLADIDQNGDMELLIGYYGLWMWDLPGYSTDPMEWPEFRHNAMRTGRYP